MYFNFSTLLKCFVKRLRLTLQVIMLILTINNNLNSSEDENNKLQYEALMIYENDAAELFLRFFFHMFNIKILIAHTDSSMSLTMGEDAVLRSL